MIEFSEYSLYDGLGLAELVKQKEVTPEELKDAAISGIQKLNPQLNAVVQVLADYAEKEINKGLPEGPFKGVPFLIKELIIHAAGVPYSMGSRLTEGFLMQHDTELMARFREAGLVTVGTTTTPEFGFNANTEAVIYGSTHNPWNLQHSPGGSSGGSGAAVAAGIVPVAHANDGGGSIRIPASCNGLVGLKPTRGRIPTGPDYGELLNGIAIEFALSRTVRDSAALLDAVSGPDLGCYGWAEPPKRPFLEEVSSDPGKLRIAWMSKPLSGVPVDKDVIRALDETVKLCQELGHELEEDAPEFDMEMYSLATYRIWFANLANMMDGAAAYIGRTPSDTNLEATSWACYQAGKEITAVELLQALDIYTMVSRSVGAFFTRYDVLLSPTTAHPPLPLGELNANAEGVGPKQWTDQIFTYAPFTNLFNATGLPAISLPLEWSNDGLPLGMQFVGRFADEANLFRLAAQLEKARPWKDKRPPVHIAR